MSGQRIFRYHVEVPYTVASHGVATFTIEGTSEETAKNEAVANTRAMHPQPIIHDARILAATPLEVVGD